MLGAASDLGLGPKFVWHDTHPLTGGRIAGRVLPHWQEAVDLAIRAHAAFSEWAVIGWDIAWTPDGPVLLEKIDQREPRKRFSFRNMSHHIRHLRGGILLAITPRFPI